MPTTRKTAARKTAKTSTSKARVKQTGKPKSNPNKSASATVKEIAEQSGVNYRKARRVAREIGLGVGKGARYDQLSKVQVKKLLKALDKICATRAANRAVEPTDDPEVVTMYRDIAQQGHVLAEKVRTGTATSEEVERYVRRLARKSGL